jgi:NADH-quinone oxidoreductase subunit L
MAADPVPIPGINSRIHRLWLGGWGFDALYDRLFVRPVLWVARVNRRDVIDLPYSASAASARLASGILSATQSGRLRWYAAVLGAGAVLVVALMVWQ